MSDIPTVDLDALKERMGRLNQDVGRGSTGSQNMLQSSLLTDARVSENPNASNISPELNADVASNPSSEYATAVSRVSFGSLSSTAGINGTNTVGNQPAVLVDEAGVEASIRLESYSSGNYDGLMQDQNARASNLGRNLGSNAFNAVGVSNSSQNLGGSGLNVARASMPLPFVPIQSFDGVKVSTHAANYVSDSQREPNPYDDAFWAAAVAAGMSPNVAASVGVASSMQPSSTSPHSAVSSLHGETPIVKSANISYAGATSQSGTSKGANNFKFTQVEKVFDGVDISMPRRVVENVGTRFDNTLYGYFIGKREAFPVVEYFVKNNWAKYGLKRIMLNTKGFFFFKFDSLVGLESVLEGGPWMIRNNPIILKKWAMNTSLLKEELNRVPVWVKLHDVPLEVFDEEGISILGSYLGKPIMLDAFTSAMCKESWGRSSFARCLIEVSSEVPLRESISVGVPLLDGTGFTKATINVEYEWKPPRCDKCKIFGHSVEACPTVVVAPKQSVNLNDGFQQVVNKKKKSSNANNLKSQNGKVGFQPSSKFVYVPKADGKTDKGKSHAVSTVASASVSEKRNEGLHSSTSVPVLVSSHMATTVPMSKAVSLPPVTPVATSNAYAALSSLNPEGGGASTYTVSDDEEDVENIYDESANLMSNSQSGASTPAVSVSNV